MRLVDEKLVKKVVVKRLADSHKGDYGRLLLIGGTYPYGGAIIMAALAAINSGAGLVTVATERDNISSLHAHLPEAMAFDLKDSQLLTSQISKADLVLIGPGLAEGDLERQVLTQVLKSCRPDQLLILDGGALSLLSRGDLPHPQAQLVLTPHQREWQLLSGLAISEQTAAANQSALAAFPAGTILVHKKAGSQIYQAGQEEIWQLEAGGPYQATGGMGDTLAGMIAGFAAQFGQATLLERVAAATYLHSAIADELAQTAYVVLPTEISQQIPRWMKRLS